jgi:hypothetical protein
MHSFFCDIGYCKKHSYFSNPKISSTAVHFFLIRVPYLSTMMDAFIVVSMGK